MPIFHIRNKLKKYRGSQWYKDNSDRYNGTVCGADPTDKDIMWHWKPKKWDKWEPCKKCLKIKQEFTQRTQ